MKVSRRAGSNRRLAGLAVLGVDVYVSRKPLAQAQSSRIVPANDHVHGPEHARPRETGVKLAKVGVPDRMLQTVAKSEAQTGGAGPSSQPARSPAAAAGSRGVAFNLLMVTFAPGVLFVSDIRQAPLAPALESGVVSFLRDVMGAIGRPPQTDAVAVEYFQWPLVRKAGVDASEARAREVLDGLLGRKLRESNTDLVVVMGRTASRCVDTGAQQHGQGQRATRIVHSEALGRLFSAPSRKEGFWRALYQATYQATSASV